uniref:Uncharacterized protein n=1 Tax=Hanusia phi TaxID=3032 RepID=A0A7S0EBU8_9CRYP
MLSPGTERTRSSSPHRRSVIRRSQSSGSMTGDDATFRLRRSLQDQYMNVYMEFKELSENHEDLLKDLNRKSDSYARRESRYREEIESLKRELENRVLEDQTGGESIHRVDHLYQRIQEGIEDLNLTYLQVKNEHEQDLLRHFRAKLYDTTSKMKTEDNQESTSGVPQAWLEKTTNLAKELDRFKEQAERLTKANMTLSANIKKLVP